MFPPPPQQKNPDFSSRHNGEDPVVILLPKGVSGVGCLFVA
jgi:hypothetical protein